MRLPWRLALMFAVAIGFANAPAAVAQGPIAVGDDCVAWATRHDRSMHMGSGTSPSKLRRMPYGTANMPFVHGRVGS